MSPLNIVQSVSFHMVAGPTPAGQIEWVATIEMDGNLCARNLFDQAEDAWAWIYETAALICETKPDDSDDEEDCEPMFDMDGGYFHHIPNSDEPTRNDYDDR